MAFSFDQIFAADPSNPSNVAQNASITIFAPGDSAMTPIAITDPDGQALTNPIPVNANGFGSAFMAGIDRVAWYGGGFTGFFTSYEGMKQVAVDAQAAAETAAATAGADAAVVATAAIGTATADAQAAAASASTAASNSAASATAAANSAALVGAPADAAMAAAANNTGSAFRGALNATYLDRESSPLGPVAFPKQPNYQMLSIFQPGHGWTATSGATPFAADTTDFIYGTQSLKGVTAGTGGAVILSSTGRPAMDFTTKTIALLLKVSDIDKLDGAYLLMGTGNFAAFRSIKLANYKGTGASAIGWSGVYQWYHAEISETNGITGTPNMAAITDLRLQVYDHNNGALTVNLQAIATYDKQSVFPGGVASFTWDDNYLPQFELAQKRVFDKWGDGCTYYIIADTLGITEPGSGPRFTLDQAHELETLHGSEISGHAFTAAQHNTSGSTTLEELEAALINLKTFLRKEGFKGADGYAWPQGNNTPAKAAVVSRYFSHARHTGGEYAPLLPSMPYRYQALTLTSDTTLAQYQAKIDFAKLHGLHLVFMGHQVKESGAIGSTNINVADLDAIVSYVHAVGMPVRTMGEVFRVTNRQNTAVATAPATLSAAQTETFDMMAAKTGTSPWLLGDDFNRADAASLGTAPSGQAWTNSVGSIAVSGRKAKLLADGNAVSLVDVGSAAHEITVECNAVAVGGHKVMGYVRAIDNLNTIRFGWDGGGLIAQRITAGSATTLADFGAQQAGDLLNSKITIKALGDQITFTFKTTSQTVTETQGLTATKVGINMTHADTSVETVKVKGL